MGYFAVSSVFFFFLEPNKKLSAEVAVLRFQIPAELAVFFSCTYKLEKVVKNWKAFSIFSKCFIFSF